MDHRDDVELTQAGLVAPARGDESPQETFSRLAEAAAKGLSHTPTFLMDEAAFRRNGRLLREIQEETEAKILLAQKAFSGFRLYPLLSEYLVGTAASGLHEARLGHEEFGGEVHVFSPAFTEAEMDELLGFADHLIFNSLSQWERFRGRVGASERRLSCGLRINPEYSEAVAEIYDPCAAGSRFGVLAADLEGANLTGIDGLHFHTLCEQGADALQRTLEHVVAKFDPWLKKMRWLNLGGGHWITTPGYDVDLLKSLIRELQARYPQLTIYLEPGEAIAVGTGVLVGSVIDLLENGMAVAVLNVSATTHMPDTLEMPYRPEVEGAGLAGEKPHLYRLGGPTCLAGDVIGDYAFDQPLKIGDQIVFHDMSHYTMVKTSTFNGVPLPDIALLREDGAIERVRRFSYADFKMRLS